MATCLNNFLGDNTFSDLRCALVFINVSLSLFLTIFFSVRSLEQASNTYIRI